MDGVTTATTALPQAELDRITDDLVAAFKTVFDPEIPVDIYELGLIYKVDINDDAHVDIEMTLTAPGCPVLAVKLASCAAEAVEVLPE